LGFGHDLGVGKVMSFFPGKGNIVIEKNAQPKKVRITSQGVFFKSPINGKELFIGPKESIKIQEALGADVIFAFDECTPPFSSYDYVKKAVKRTHDWAKICVNSKKSNQALFGIVQGSKFEDLRNESARYINLLDFDGFGIGGDLGETKKDMAKILSWIIPNLDGKKTAAYAGHRPA
jgi:queuine tRNA-ribosyltransferase